MALKLENQNASWTMVMLNTEINFAKNPNEFAQFYEMKIPKNGKVEEVFRRQEASSFLTGIRMEPVTM